MLGFDRLQAAPSSTFARHFHRSSLQGSLSHITRGLKVPFLLPREEGEEEELSADKTGKLLWLYAANRY